MRRTTTRPSSNNSLATGARRGAIGAALLCAVVAATAPGTTAAHTPGSEVSDYEIFRSCYGQAPSGPCAATDVNGDGVVNVRDFLELRLALKYDLNGDLVIDLVYPPDNPDVSIFRACFGRAPVGNCAGSDFNADGRINSLDLGLLRSSRRFDFNGDGRVDVNQGGNRAPFFESVPRGARFAIATKTRFGLYAVGRDVDGDTFTYDFDRGRLPENARVRRVVYGDVNRDRVVDQGDLDSITAAMGRYDARLDLDASGIVDQRDYDLALAEVGKQRAALYFTWKPEDDQVGTYSLTFAITDEHGTSNHTIVTLLVRTAAD
jgi:hypothetical protein